MKTIKFHTLGCKVNQYDTQSIRERFAGKGFLVSDNGKQPDIFVINTCTVTHAADRKSKWAIRQAVKNNPSALILVTGCLVKNDWRSVAAIEGVDCVIDKGFFPSGISDFSGRARAFIKAQDGCDNKCSFCKVRLARGRSVSRPKEEVIKEARGLAAAGFKEIVLTGICLGAYGRDRGIKAGLVQLIDELEKIRGLRRIRLSSIEAGDVTDGLIDRIAGSKILCPHLHIPFQSGDDHILKRMNKTLIRDDHIRTVRGLKEKIADFALSMDIMVGFPGEEEANFKNTVDFIKETEPLKVHIFPYSKREGTEAAGFKGEVPPHILRQRLDHLDNLCKEVSLDFRKRFIGRRLEVLIESKPAGEPSMYEGHTANYIKVRMKSGRSLLNKAVTAELAEIYDNFAAGLTV
ncbi:MAG: MiaB/RimO family radical SAM methylthiotransferase [Candidatus Omnitrophica bacterium]|nr:MiaB/RimO family radical SAM methylthiotransferase [Candidatus Omnitrophota bacterium]